MSALLFLVIALTVLVLVTMSLGAEGDRNLEDHRGWRFRPLRDHRWLYEERVGDTWRTLEFRCGEPPGDSPSTIFVPDADAWQRFPDWAAGRRGEIVDRILQDRRVPDLQLVTIRHPNA